MAVGIGTGTTLTHGSLSGGMTSIAHSGTSRPSIPVPHMETTVSVPKVPGALVDWGSLTAEIILDSSVDLDTWITAASAAASPLVITFPSGSIFTVTAFVTGMDLFGIPLEDVITASVTFELAALPVKSGT